jgi:uncharacterized protein YukE
VSQLGEHMTRAIKESSDNTTGVAQEVINKAGLWTSKNAEQMDQLVEKYQVQTSEQIAIGQSQVEAFTTILSDLMVQLKETTGSSVTEMSATLTAVTHNLSEKVSQLGEHMTRAIKESSDNTTGAAQEVINKAGLWTSKSAEQMDQLVEKYQVQIELTSELKDALKSALIGFKESLGMYGQITGDFKQVTNDVNVTVKLMTQVSTVIRENQESLKIIAGLTKEQIQQLRGANQDQKDIWKGIYDSMQTYRTTFQQVENSAKGLLTLISDNLANYTEQTEDNFKKLVQVSNEHFGTAVKKLSGSVEELDELLQNLNEIIHKK